MAGEKQIELMIPADRDYKKPNINDYNKNHLGTRGEKNIGFDHHLEDSDGTAEGVTGNYKEKRDGGFLHDAIDMHSGLYYLNPVVSIYDGVVKNVCLYGVTDSGQSSIIIEHNKINFSFLKGNEIAYSDGETKNKLISSYVHMRFIAPNPGDIVKKGEVIGFLGGIPRQIGSGKTEQMHLHFGLGIKYYTNGQFMGGSARILSDKDQTECSFINKNDKEEDKLYYKSILSKNIFINPYLYGSTNDFFKNSQVEEFLVVNGVKKPIERSPIENVYNYFRWVPFKLNSDIFENRFKKAESLLLKLDRIDKYSMYIGDNLVSYDSSKRALNLKTPNNITPNKIIERIIFESHNKDLSIINSPIKRIVINKNNINVRYANDKLLSLASDDEFIGIISKEFINKVFTDDDDEKCGHICDYKFLKSICINNISQYLKTQLLLLKTTFIYPRKEALDYVLHPYLSNFNDFKGLKEDLNYVKNELFIKTSDILGKILNKFSQNKDDYFNNQLVDDILEAIVQSNEYRSENDLCFPFRYHRAFLHIMKSNSKESQIKKIKEILDNPIRIISEGNIPLYLMKYAGYYFSPQKTIFKAPVSKENFSILINSLISKLNLKLNKKRESPLGYFMNPKPFIGPPLPLNLNSEIKFPNINPPAKVATATAAKTISSVIMGLFGMGKQGLGTGGEKAGGALGMPSNDISQTTARATGMGNKPTANDKDRYNKDILADKPKTANANTGPKQNNLLVGKNKPGANSWQDMIKGAFGNLTVGGGKGSISSPKSVAPQQDTNALAKANTASQPYPALTNMKNAVMPSKPYGAGFQAPTVHNPALSAQKSGRFMGPPAPTSIPSFASASHKPQLPNTNYIPESAPKGNAVKNKKKQDSQPGKPKLTEIAIRGENADRYELIASELPSMWERQEKESAQRLI